MCSLKLSDRHTVLGALLDYHLMIKVKAEMDQFKGLQTLGYLEVCSPTRPCGRNTFWILMCHSLLVCVLYIIMYVICSINILSPVAT